MSSAGLVTVIFSPPSPSTHFPLMSPLVLINDGSLSPNCFARGELGSTQIRNNQAGKRTAFAVAKVLAILKRTSWFCFATVLSDVRRKIVVPIRIGR